MHECIHIHPGHQPVDVDPLHECVYIDPSDEPVDVDPVEHRVEIDPLQDGVEIDPLEELISIDAAGHRGDDRARDPVDSRAQQATTSWASHLIWSPRLRHGHHLTRWEWRPRRIPGVRPSRSDPVTPVDDVRGVALMSVCAALLVTALGLAVRWSDLVFQAPIQIDAPSASETVRRYAWYCSLLLAAGITAGITVMGCGGRLAMRLLAVTAGDGAQGRITEAEEVVGRITLGGTISFVLFTGIFGGVVAAAIYLVVRRFLPSGWVGGLTFGVGLLVVLGTTTEPLRDDNPDFDLVGPGWLSVLIFTALALAFGLVLAAFAGRLSAWLPLPSNDRATVARYAPIGVLALVGFQLTLILSAVGAVVVAATRCQPLVRAARSPAALWLGRAILVAIVAFALPDALASVADIVGR